jgi:hypothetical protein
LVEAVPPKAAEGVDGPFEPGSSGGLMLLLGAAGLAQRNAWVRGLVELEQASLAISAELREAAGRFDERRRGAFALAEFRVAAFVAGAVHVVGDLPRTHEWLLRAVVDEYRGDGEYQWRVERLFLWAALPPSVLRQSAANDVLQWLTTLFAHSERSGDHVELAALAYDMLDGLVDAGVIVAASSGVHTLQAMMFRANWAETFAPKRVITATAPLVGLLDTDMLKDDERALLDAFVATFSVQLTERQQPELAAEALERHGAHYEPSVRFALRVASCAGDASRIQGTQEELLGELALMRAEAREEAVSPSERLLRRGQSFKRMEGVLKAYAEAGLPGPAVELLAAWMSDPREGALLAEPTLAVSNHPVGTLWCIDGSSAPDHPIVPDPNAEFTVALNAFLGTTVLAREAPGTLRRVERPLHPNADAAQEFERAALVHLRLIAWMDLDVDRLSRATVLVPGVPIPLQPLLLRELGKPTALSVSMREPAPSRPVRTVALMGDNTFTSPIELEAIEHRFADSGAEVVRLPPTTDAFRDAYDDERFDVLWVAAHGEYEGLRLETSALVLATDEQLTLDELAAFEPPKGDRRALVLNVCSGGHSAVLGGLMEIGLGSVLAGPSQTVVSHLWPVFPQFAAAFGALYADALIRCVDHLDAYASTVNALLRGRDEIERSLSGLPGAGEVLERFSNATHDYESIAAWGSPILLC